MFLRLKTAHEIFACFSNVIKLNFEHITTAKLHQNRFWSNSEDLEQGCTTLLLAIDCPAKFSSNSNQTHLSLIFKRS